MLHQDNKALIDKKLLALERELNHLYNIRYNAPIIPLKKPFQCGWVKYFKFRDDIVKRTNEHILKHILSKFNKTIYCKTKNFLDWYDQPIIHTLKILPKKLIETYNWTPPYKKWLLYGHWQENNVLKRIVEGYIFSIPHYFLVDKIDPYIVTHTKVHLPEIEQRIKEINNKLEKNQYWKRLNKIHGIKTSYYEDKTKSKEEIFIKQGMDPNLW